MYTVLACSSREAHAHFTGMHMPKVEIGRNGGSIGKDIFQIRNGKWKMENGNRKWKSALGFRKNGHEHRLPKFSLKYLFPATWMSIKCVGGVNKLKSGHYPVTSWRLPYAAATQGEEGLLLWYSSPLIIMLPRIFKLSWAEHKKAKVVFQNF